jgi:hypothetical protein
MKQLLVALGCTLGLVSFSHANELTGLQSTVEQAFISHVQEINKDQILAEFGQPSQKEDLVGDDAKVFASIWRYHNLNKDEKGVTYPVTELDFVDDKVVLVVFMNDEDAIVNQSVPSPEKF